MAFFNTTCNSTLEELDVDGEIPIVGPLRFHDLALIIGGACTLFAIAMSLFLITMHALHYTKPYEQKHIIRILFMVPVYATSAFLQLRFFKHAVYFQVISECYEAFAIASFFALLCHYLGPDLHEQKDFFRRMRPIKPWVWPLNWFAACCGKQRGPWRTPKSGLTWFNINWIGIFQFCFIRVAMTITAVVTQYFHKYCESSNSPVFGHIWVLVIVFISVGIAMYCVIQFYWQLKEPLAEHRPFLKVLAIKLVVFLCFWQTAAISVATSTLNIIHPNEIIAYPDLKVGIPALLLTFEMACFAIMHIWAYPYKCYLDDAPKTYYPVADPNSGEIPKLSERKNHASKMMGFRAIVDAMNLWDVVKAFGRGMRWLFCGVKNRHKDAAYRNDELKNLSRKPGLDPEDPNAKSTDHLPIAQQFRRSRFNIMMNTNNSINDTQTSGHQQNLSVDSNDSNKEIRPDEARSLMRNAQQPGRRGDLSPLPEEPSPAPSPGPYSDIGEANSSYGPDDTRMYNPNHPAHRYSDATMQQQRHRYSPDHRDPGYRYSPDPYEAAEHAVDMRGQGGAYGGAGDRYDDDSRLNSVRTRVGESMWGEQQQQRRDYYDGRDGGGDGHQHRPGSAF